MEETTNESLLLTENEETDTVTEELNDYELDYDSSESDYLDLWKTRYSDLDTDDELLYSTTGLDLTNKESIESFVKSEGFTAFIAAFASIVVIMSIFSLLYSIYMAIVNFMISKKMGRGTGFAVASIFFWPIMGGILAFSKNRALENSATTAAPTSSGTKTESTTTETSKEA